MLGYLQDGYSGNSEVLLVEVDAIQTPEWASNPLWWGFFGSGGRWRKNKCISKVLKIEHKMHGNRLFS
jgi:hypothetical protein